MRTAFGDEPEAAVLRAKQGETLAKNFQGDHGQLGVLSEFGRGRDGMPKAPHIVAHRGAGPDARQPLAAFSDSFVSRTPRRRHIRHRSLPLDLVHETFVS